MKDPKDYAPEEVKQYNEWWEEIRKRMVGGKIRTVRLRP